MVIIFGSINADLIFKLDALPQPGQTLLAHSMQMEPGGKGANQAIAATRGGAQVAMVGAVGHDGLASIALQGLQASGMDLSRVIATDTPTGCASICTDTQGRNQIAVTPGANGLAKAAQVEDALLTPANTLLLQMECDVDETAALITRAKARGTRIILNLAPAIFLPRDVLQLVDFLVVNEDEAASLGHALSCGADANALHHALGISVLRTLGGEGVEAATGERAFKVPAKKINVVDSTAAGDCFVGVLGAALDRGSPLEAAVARANAAAALACTRQGSQNSIPIRAETDAMMHVI